MSTRYPGGIITKTPVVPAGPYEDGTAPGIWTLDQQLQAAKSGIWPTAGNIDPGRFIENIFSTYLYTGNDVALTVTNGIDLSGEGGLVWGKSRSGVQNHRLYDTARGSSFSLISNATSAQSNQGANACAFNADGFSLSAASGIVGSSGFGGPDYVSWTFRKQPKFFDIVTWTGNSTARTIAHNLGSVPGCIIVKGYANMAPLGNASTWTVYHRSLGNTKAVFLNSTAAEQTSITYWNNTTPTSSVFTVGTDSDVNQNTVTYVAYLFAHDAGGFGLTGTDNVISCGSFTTDGSGNATVNLGYEPQWLLVKPSSGGGTNWRIIDVMRGFTAGATNAILVPNTTGAETSAANCIGVTSTGFTGGSNLFDPSTDVIYIAIRRGPMKVPTDATKVFTPIYSAAAANTVLTTSFPIDLQIPAYTGGTIGRFVVDRLRGVVTTAVDAATSPWMKTNATDAETTGFNITRAWDNTGYQIPQYLGGATTVYFNFRRAPGFFDEVCYTGTGVARTVTHNLAAAPELIIVKDRNAGYGWIVYNSFNGATAFMRLQTNLASASSSTMWNDTAPTSSVFTLGSNINTNNGAGETYVAYLFATCPGVSKVGSYTGNGTTQTINCGFTSGARFVLIKRTDATGDWYVYDTARGMTVLTDPYLLLNTADAEVATLGSVTTVSTGFALNSTILAAINVNAGSYIFFAVS